MRLRIRLAAETDYQAGEHACVRALLDEARRGEDPRARIEALSLRLYNPESRQWSLNFASSRGGTLSLPTIGEFNGTRGEFYSQESLDGRAILVRFIISPVAPDTCRFEQAFSTDGGRTWEVNWLATDTREPGGLP